MLRLVIFFLIITTRTLAYRYLSDITLICDSEKTCRLENLAIDLYRDGHLDFRQLNYTALVAAENLTITGAGVKELPKNLITALPNLRHLVAEKCNLEKLDVSLLGGPKPANLLTLNLNGNQFPILFDGHFASAAELQELHLQECGIEVIQSYAFDGLVQLKELTLNYNYISEIDSIVWSSMKALSSLYLIGNQLTTLDFNVFQQNLDLQELEVGVNQISSLIAPKHEMQLTWLDLTQNHLVSIQPLQSLNSLEALLLSFNSHLSLLPESFDSFASSLKVLHLVSVNLADQHVTFERLFGQLLKLQLLNIGKNALVRLNVNELPILPSVLFFHIFENGLRKIENLERIKEKLPELTKSDISQNIWDCKELSNMLEVFERLEIELDFVDDYPEKPRDGMVRGRLNNLKGVGCLNFDDYIFSKLSALDNDLESKKVELKAKLEDISTLSARLNETKHQLATREGEIESYQKDLNNLTESKNTELEVKSEEISTLWMRLNETESRFNNLTVSQRFQVNESIALYNYLIIGLACIGVCLFLVCFLVGRHFAKQ